MIPVIVDTREQRPWAFPPTEFVTNHAGLMAGDYSLAGLESRVSIERKSLGDFVSTVVHDWIRFRKELYRLAGFDVACVAVESTADAIMRGEYESDAAPNAVLGRAHEIFIDHGIPVLFWSDAATAEKMAARLLRLAWARLGPEKSRVKIASVS